MSQLTLNVDRNRIPKKIEEDNHWWFASRTRALLTILNKYTKRRDMMISDRKKQLEKPNEKKNGNAPMRK